MKRRACNQVEGVLRVAIQPRAAATRQRIVAAAVDLFTANGYLETTPQMIATEAGVTTGAFYYHFASKENLAAAIVDEGWPEVAATLSQRSPAHESGMLNAIEAVFAVAGILNRDRMRWIAFHLNMAIGHLSPPARQSYRERVQAFSVAVVGGFQDSELRDGVTRQQAGELLWIMLSGAQLLSDVFEGESSLVTRCARLGTAWKSVLRTIVPDAQLPGVLAFVDETAVRYGRMGAQPLAPASDSVT